MATIPIQTNQILSAAKAVRIKFVLAVGNRAVPQGDPVIYLEQVSSKLLTSFPVTRVFEFRVTRPGMLTKITLFSPDNVASDVTFDVNKGTRTANLATIFPTSADRPKITSGTYSVEKTVSIPVSAGDLISIDVDAATENLRYLTAVCKIET
ncbi:MAG: hypothetical protein LUM44_09680 [Pyrinomonadaceae bacterium]|nr:hypothetical protein [Pyrinomonadaceae bacterium]